MEKKMGYNQIDGEEDGVQSIDGEEDGVQSN